MHTPRKLLVFRSGLLGDTLVALPALWTLRRSFPAAHITYLWQNTGVPGHVAPPDVLGGSGVVDDFLELSLRGTSVDRWRNYVRLWLELRRSQFDTALVLEANHWSRRPELFLRSTGIPFVARPGRRMPKVYRDEAGTLPRVPHIADELLTIVSGLGIRTPRAGAGDMSLPRTVEERRNVDSWLARNHVPGDALLIAIGPGSNMPAKRWPIERFQMVVASLIKRFDVVPVILGAEADRELGLALVKACGRGIVAAGELGIREGVELLGRCVLFLGNDTGTMHMAVSAGTPVVAVFAATDMPGRWEPYGPGNTAFRLRVDCEGCLLRECVREGMRCLLGISIDDVAAACRDVVARSLTGAA
jgi:ADP-heptose:LPS heptosyltransferase